MRPLGIVKVGSAPPELVAEKGDFEQWIADRLRADPLDIRVVDATALGALPGPEAWSGVVVTGSSAMVTERAPWSEAAARWLVDAVALGTPVLGICYGHQLLAHGLGGRVAANPNGREIGTVSVELDVAADTDPLFGGLDGPLTVQVTHRESVETLPSGAVLLGANAFDRHQAVRFADRAWGVQFHPEFDAAVSRGYLRIRHDELLAEGLDPRALLAAVRDAPDGARLLARFGTLVREAESGETAVSRA